MHVDWSRTKTIFIITFFVLDLFLGYQLYQKQSNNQFEYMSESSVKMEDQLKNAEITYEELPSVPKKLSHVIGEAHTFTKDEIDKIEKEDVKITKTDDSKQLFGTFNEPKSTIGTEAEARSLVESYILYSNEYIYSDALSRKDKEFTFIQTYDGRPIFQKEDNANGQVKIQLDSEGKMMSFSQTYLTTTEEGNEQEILTAINAIYQLYNKNKLKTNDTITHIKLGYYSIIEGKVQVLAPTWLIEVNEERHYYVNAINGLIDDPNIEALLETGDEHYESDV